VSGSHSYFDEDKDLLAGYTLVQTPISANQQVAQNFSDGTSAGIVLAGFE
jgi:hypothetical protein